MDVDFRQLNPKVENVLQNEPLREMIEKKFFTPINVIASSLKAFHIIQTDPIYKKVSPKNKSLFTRQSELLRHRCLRRQTDRTIHLHQVPLRHLLNNKVHHEKTPVNPLDQHLPNSNDSELILMLKQQVTHGTPMTCSQQHQTIFRSSIHTETWIIRL